MSQPASLPPFPPDDSPYWVSSALDIRQLMKTLSKRQERLTLWVGNHQSFLTAVLEARESGELLLDFGGDSELNKKALGMSNLSVTATLDRVDIRFEISSLSQVSFEGGPAFMGKIPSRVHKLQRREYFRVPTPVSKPLRCGLIIPARPELKLLAIEGMADVLDIGLGGMCLLEPGDTLKLVGGMVFKDARLDLGEFGSVAFDLEVCHVFDVENRLGKRKRRAGCKFVKLSHAAEATIQRYMTKIERDRRLAAD